MALKTRMWGAGKLLALLAGLAVTYVLCFAVAVRVALRAREVTVPPLVGRSVNDATSLLNGLDLALRVEEARRPDARVARGLVLSQDPRPGIPTRRSRTIRVWLSDGPVATIVPALVGESERTATLRAEAGSLNVDRVVEIRSGDYPTGVVVAQTPEPRSRAASVTLLVNRGEVGGGYVMPDLIGVSAARASRILRAGGFRVAIVGEQSYPGAPSGTVLRQNPSAGFQVSTGDAISLEVSR